MTIDRRVSSIESSFKMESMPFDAECRQRVRDVLVTTNLFFRYVSYNNQKPYCYIHAPKSA